VTQKARATGFHSDAVVGQIPVGRAPIALTFSADHQRLYTTSQVAPETYGWPPVCHPPASTRLPGGRHARSAARHVDQQRKRPAQRHPLGATIDAEFRETEGLQLKQRHQPALCLRGSRDGEGTVARASSAHAGPDASQLGAATAVLRATGKWKGRHHEHANWNFEVCAYSGRQHHCGGALELCGTSRTGRPRHQLHDGDP